LEHLIDPYAIFDVYAEGLSRENMERFLLGDGEDEPRLDVLVEEVDDLRLKIELRNLCRQFGIPVLMMSDLGHRAQVLWQDFSKDQSLSLAPGVSDEEVYERLEAAYKDRKGKFKFIETICGSDYAVDEFKDWVEGRGEQMGSSLPQLGTTAKASAGIGGFRIAEYILGRQFPVEERLTYDLRYGTVFRS